MTAKDLNNITVEININGTPCDFSQMELHQTMFGHHIFSIHLNYRAKKQDLWAVTAESVMEQLGSSVTIQIKEQEGATIDFEGVVTRIDIEGRDSNQGVAVLHGGSPTLLMKNDFTMASFAETDLASIVHETIMNIGHKIEHKIEPLNNPEISYICRYKESSYDFLNRLLSSCGEWFFYDGKKIIVGFSAEQKSQAPIEISYKYDLVNMKISSTLGNYDVEQYDYDSTGDRIFQWISPPDSENTNKFTQKAFNHSKSIYQDYTILPSTIPVCQKTFNLMENSVNATHFGKLSEGSLLEASTHTCKMALGSIVSIDIAPEMAKYTKEMGRFRIIEVTHRYNHNRGAYENDIVGVNADIEYVPSRNVVIPVAMPEIAKIMDNKDPRNMGRVKVQFIWQQLEDHPKGKTSGWMRVQSLHAGGSGTVQKDRGFFFVPEVGDQVMVGYEYGDPNRPFVMGSMFHKNNTEGMAADNSIKSIKTCSGHTLEFNDDEKGDWGITIKDHNGCVLCFDSKEKEIYISAPQKITMESKDIMISANNKIEITSAKTISINADENIICVTKEMETDVENGYTLHAKELTEIAEKAEIQSTKDNLTLTSGKEVINKSKSKKIRLS